MPNPLRTLARDSLQDLRVGARMARRNLFTSAIIVACLGISIGSMATVFSWIRGLVLRPVPAVSAPERLLSIATRTTRSTGLLSYPAYEDIRDGSPTLEAIAAFGIRRFNAAVDSDASAATAPPVWGVLVSSNYFEVLGVRPQSGRWFLREEEQPGGPSVAVISHAFWQTRLGGSPHVVGRPLRVNGREVTIIGIAPRDFRGTITGLGFDLWLPLTMHAVLADNAALLSDRSTRWLQVIGRIRSGFTMRQVREDMTASGQRLSAIYPEDREQGISVDVLDTGPARLLRPLLAVLFGTTILLLLIVCSNVANLLILRGADRAHELEVRAALGAGRLRLMRQLLVENLFLTAAGIAVAFVVAAWGRNLFARLAPASSLPINLEVSIDWSVALLTIAVGVGTLLAFGVLPAIRAAGKAMRPTLTISARFALPSGTRLRGMLVSAQFALSFAAIVGCALFLRRLNDLAEIDRGFTAPERVVLVTTDFALGGYRGDTERRDAVQRVLTRLREQPAVAVAAAATFVPLGFGGYSAQDVQVEGYVPVAGESMNFLVNQVSGDYFKTMGVALVHGRAIDATDRMETLPVVIVNEAFVRRFSPAQDPVGRRVRLNDRDFTVVGVAKDGKYHYRDLDNATPPFIYSALAQTSWSTVVLHVRPTGDPAALVGVARSVLAAVNPNLIALSPTTLDDHTSVGLFPVRLGTAVLGSLGSAALILAALGLYAVIAHSVRQRYREIGIRMALGASSMRIVATVVKDSWRYVAFGVALGLLVGTGVARVMASALPNLQPGGAAPFVVALVLLCFVATLATALPAWTATTMNPTNALKLN